MSPPLPHNVFHHHAVRRRALGSRHRCGQPSPQQPPPHCWCRCARARASSAQRAEVARAGPGRRPLSEQVGEFRLPWALILSQAYPFGLHDRRRLIEQAVVPSDIGLDIGRHVTHPLSRMRRPGPRGCGGPRQALMAVLSVLLVISMRRGLAFSATGMVNRNTPPE